MGVDVFSSRRRPGFTTPRRTAWAAALFLVAVPLFAVDLVGSLREYRVLESWTICSGSGPDCITEETVTFDGPRHVRRQAADEWTATGADGSRTVFGLLPAYGDDTETLAGPGVLYRVNGKVVAVHEAGSNWYVPTALSGAHAIAFDAYGLLVSLTLVLMGIRTLWLSRLNGLGWGDQVPPGMLRPGTVPFTVLSVMLLTGSAGGITTFMIGIPGWIGWGAIPLGVAVVAASFDVALRVLRKWRGYGRHAA